jgi:hypothetical protein
MSIIFQVFYLLYHAAKIDIRLIIQSITMGSEQMVLNIGRFIHPDEGRPKEKGTFETERIDI